jgi:hypothetical protein
MRAEAAAVFWCCAIEDEAKGFYPKHDLAESRLGKQTVLVGLMGGGLLTTTSEIKRGVLFDLLIPTLTSGERNGE